jgi:CRISPR-associated endoribonuclease Cas6
MFDQLLRIILHLKSLANQFRPNFEYHYKLQGFIYSLLKNTSFENLHNKKGYKFFCFSNIFSRNHDINNSLFNMIIASPSSQFIEQVCYQLQKIVDYQIPIEIGNIFELQDFVRVQNKNVSFPLEIITGTPIIIRIPLEKFAKSSTDSAPHKSIFWRYSYPLNLFVEAIESNLKKKYQEFTNSPASIEDTTIMLEKFRFKRQVSTHIFVGNSRIPVIGSLWEFAFSEIIPKEIQLFALDCGLGERNSLGFGFMNPILTTQIKRH